MEVSLGSVTLAILAIFLTSKALSFSKNYIAGRRTGFPIVVSPVLSKSILWMVFGAVFQPQFKKYFPAWLYDRCDLVTHGWEFRRKANMHESLGKSFVVVSPDECTLWYVAWRHIDAFSFLFIMMFFF
jgi:hypothetical protein